MFKDWFKRKPKQKTTNIEFTHLSFDAHRDEKYLYIRCREHPEIVFMLDPIEEHLLFNMPVQDKKDFVWFPLFHDKPFIPDYTTLNL